MSNLLFPLADVGCYIDGREIVDNVQIDTMQSDQEIRSVWSLAPRIRYMIKQNVLRSSAKAEFQRWVSQFLRARGSLDSFLVDDPEDDSVTDHGFGIGDGATTAFQLQRMTPGAFYDSSGPLYTQQSKPYTNLLKNSGFEADANGDGVADNWSVYNNSPSTEPTVALIIPGIGGGKAQRVQWGTNNSTVKGVQQVGTSSPAFLAGQWYTWTCSARASGTNVGKFLGFQWNSPGPSQTLAISNPPLTTSFQRYAFQLFWNVGLVPLAEIHCSISGAAAGVVTLAATFGTLDFDQVMVVPGQWGVNDLQPIETPAAAGATDNPAYWPGYTDGFLPVYDLNGDTTIFQDGDWPSRRQLYPYPRTNILPNSEAIDQWTATNAIVTVNATTAPDGTSSGDQISEGTATTVQHGVNSTGVAADAAGELRCWSIFVKANTLPNITIAAPSAFGVGVNFNLGTGVIDGVIGGAIASGIQTSPLWSGWIRVWFVRRGTALSTSLALRGCLDGTYSSAGYTGTSRTFFAWGAMCERVADLNGPTPYIRTPSTTAVTVTDYTVSSAALVTFPVAPPAGSFFSWTGKYFIRARFEDAKLSLQRIVQQLYSTGVSLISVKSGP